MMTTTKAKRRRASRCVKNDAKKRSGSAGTRNDVRVAVGGEFREGARQNGFFPILPARTSNTIASRSNAVAGHERYWEKPRQ